MQAYFAVDYLHSGAQFVVMERIANPTDRLRLLNDCRVVRASMRDMALGHLCKLGAAQRRFIPYRVSEGGKCDYLITPKGERMAYELFKRA